MNVVAWTVVGWGDLPRFLDLLSAVSAHEEGRSYSVLALGLQLGAGRTAALGIALALAGAVSVACFVQARRGRDEQALLLGVTAALIATPIVWTHYFVLLIVPLAILRPRVGWLWALPLVMLLCPTGRADTWQLVVVLATATALVVAALRSAAPEPAAA
jgi:hypothetical protein